MPHATCDREQRVVPVEVRFCTENWSLGTDLALLARTVKAVLSREGAW